VAWFHDVDGNVFWEELPQGAPPQAGPSLQDASKISGVKRGTIFRVAAGTPTGLIPGAIPLRVENGTWAFTAFRVASGLGGFQVAAAPPNTPGQIRWPFRVALQHGVGAASWLELVSFAARGTTFVRAGDYMEAQIIYEDAGFGPIGEDLGIALVASQLIVPLTTSLVSTEVLADGNGVATHTVPPGATTLQYIGGAPTALVFRDIDGVVIASSGPPGLQVVRVPLNAATVDAGTIAVALPTTVQWEVAL
jgi:hypothetical protein